MRTGGVASLNHRLMARNPPGFPNPQAFVRAVPVGTHGRCVPFHDRLSPMRLQHIGHVLPLFARSSRARRNPFTAEGVMLVPANTMECVRRVAALGGAA